MEETTREVAAKAGGDLRLLTANAYTYLEVGPSRYPEVPAGPLRHRKRNTVSSRSVALRALSYL
eukprot:206398-Rhodomonas_salina.1